MQIGLTKTQEIIKNKMQFSENKKEPEVIGPKPKLSDSEDDDSDSSEDNNDLLQKSNMN